MSMTEREELLKAIRAGFSKRGLSARYEVLNAIADEVAAIRTAPAQGDPVSIFEECAKIAEDHVMNTRLEAGYAYNEACRDIAEAIRVTASNRKTMDAIATEKSRS